MRFWKIEGLDEGKVIEPIYIELDHEPTFEYLEGYDASRTVIEITEAEMRKVLIRRTEKYYGCYITTLYGNIDYLPVRALEFTIHQLIQLDLTVTSIMCSLEYKYNSAFKFIHVLIELNSDFKTGRTISTVKKFGKLEEVFIDSIEYLL